MFDISSPEFGRPTQESMFQVVDGLSNPQTVIHVGTSVNEMTHAEVRIVDGTLYVAQPNPTGEDVTSDTAWSALYVDREKNQWFLKPLADTEPQQKDGALCMRISDLHDPYDESKMLQPIAVINIDPDQQTLMFYPKETQRAWNGARYEPQLAEMYLQTPDQIYDFTRQNPTDGWEKFQEPKEIINNEQNQRKHTLKDIAEVGNRLAQILRKFNENSVSELPPNLQTEVKFNHITRQFIAHVHMHSDGVEMILGTGREEVREVGKEYGFGSRVVFLQHEFVSSLGGGKTIRGSMFLQEYSEDGNDFVQQEILSGIDIVGERARKGMSWTMVMNHVNPDVIMTSLQGMVRCLRPHKD